MEYTRYNIWKIRPVVENDQYRLYTNIAEVSRLSGCYRLVLFAFNVITFQ